MAHLHWKETFKFCVQELCVLAYKASEWVSWWFDTRRTCACATVWRSQRGLVSLPRRWGWDSPASLVKTLHLQCGGAGCIADWETKTPPTTGSCQKEREVRLPAHFSHSLCDKRIFSPKKKKILLTAFGIVALYFGTPSKGKNTHYLIQMSWINVWIRISQMAMTGIVT